jgi:DNA polymerase I
MNNKVIIIDGHAIIHRSFHALPSSLKTKDGQITNAVYGFTTFLIKALKELKPAYAILTLDEKGPNFRHQAYSEYKATRKKSPPELNSQIPLVKKIAEAFSLPIFSLKGYEADDLIGSLARKINQENPEKEVVIITGDLDTLQLVNKKTEIYTMSRGLSDSVIYDEDRIKERYNLKPGQLIDLKALRGDPSDNIPGVAGIGEKTGVELLTNFQDLDNIYKNIDSPKITPRVRELLLKNKDMAYLSRDLGTIKLDAPINLDLKRAEIKQLDKKKINSAFSELEFHSLLGRIFDLNLKSKESEEKIDKFKRNQEKFNYQLINTEKDFQSFLKKIEKEKTIAFDIESDSINPLEAEILGISFSWKEDEAYYINLNLKKGAVSLFDQEAKKANNTEAWLEEIKKIIENEKTTKVAHNIKYDLQVLKNYDIEVKGPIFDTMIASYLLNPEKRQHNLDSLSFSELNWEKIKVEELLKDKQNNFSEIETEKLAIYSCEDVDFSLKLKKVLEKKLKERKLEELFEKMEIPLIKVLASMERSGISLDLKFLEQLRKKVRSDIEKLEKKIFELAKEKFNLNSPKQLKEVLYEKIKISSQGVKKIKTGFSTASEELEKIKDLHPIIKFIQSYRELNKLESTYIKALPKLISPKSKRIHTSFNQSITATGRLSSSNPNLQNIPVKTELGNKIRQAFIAPQGKKFLSLDYSQIELRIMAHLSKDKKLIKAFQEDIDIHQATAASINNISLEDVSEELRNSAKAINFGILYGQGPHGLSQSANISYYQAKQFIDKYFELYPGVKEFINKTIKLSEEKGYTETIFKRRREIPEINSQEKIKRKNAERIAINSPIQGSAADIIKLAMIEIHEEIKGKEEEIKMILQIHDELIFELEESKINYYNKKIERIMENITKLDVPLKIRSYTGKNWGEIERIK